MTASAVGASDAQGHKAASFKDEGSSKLARAYAEALVNAAEKSGNAEEVLDELDAIRDFVTTKFPTFASMMSSPIRNQAERDTIITKAFDGRVLETSIRFLRVLNRHGRLELLGAILRTARETWDRRQNRKPVTIRSAVPLSDAQRDALTNRLAGSLQATPILHVEIDPSLLGGLVVQVGDDVYDASVRNRLEQLRKRLIEGKTHEIQSRRDHFSHSE
jgi:F-type H+-transporting ATPase subunit delta